MIWHLPWIYDTALENPSTLLHVEHAMYFVTGLAMWWCVFQDEPHRLGSGARAGYVFAAFVLASPVGLVMAFVPNPIYDFYVEAHHRVWGLSPLEDQQLAGMLMAFEQAVVFFAVFAYWFFRVLAEEGRREDVRPSAARPFKVRPVRRLVVLVAGATLAVAALSAQAATPGFPYGVAAGEVKPTSVVLWTRASRPGNVSVNLGTPSGSLELRGIGPRDEGRGSDRACEGR